MLIISFAMQSVADPGFCHVGLRFGDWLLGGRSPPSLPSPRWGSEAQYWFIIVGERSEPKFSRLLDACKCKIFKNSFTYGVYNHYKVWASGAIPKMLSIISLFLRALNPNLNPPPFLGGLWLIYGWAERAQNFFDNTKLILESINL